MFMSHTALLLMLIKLLGLMMNHIASGRFTHLCHTLLVPHFSCRLLPRARSAE